LMLRFAFTALDAPSPASFDDVFDFLFTGTKLSVFLSNSWFPGSVYALHRA
jgi:hypothetical protein